MKRRPSSYSLDAVTVVAVWFLVAALGGSESGRNYYRVCPLHSVLLSINSWRFEWILAELGIGRDSRFQALGVAASPVELNIHSVLMAHQAVSRNLNILIREKCFY